MTKRSTINKAVELKEKEINSLDTELVKLREKSLGLQAKIEDLKVQYSKPPGVYTVLSLWGQTKSAIHAEITKTLEDIKNINTQLAELNEKKKEANLQKKKYEKFLDRLSQKELALAAKQEQKAMDEMAQVMLRQAQSKVDLS